MNVSGVCLSVKRKEILYDSMIFLLADDLLILLVLTLLN